MKKVLGVVMALVPDLSHISCGSKEIPPHIPKEQAQKIMDGGSSASSWRTWLNTTWSLQLAGRSEPGSAYRWGGPPLFRRHL